MNVEYLFEKMPYFIVFEGEEREQVRKLCEEYDDPLVEEIRNLGWDELKRLYMEKVIEILDSGGNVEEYSVKFFRAVLCKLVSGGGETGELEDLRRTVAFVRSGWERLGNGIKAFRNLDWDLVRRFTEVVDPADTSTSWWAKLYAEYGEETFMNEWNRVFGIFDRAFLNELGVVIEYIIKSGFYELLGGYDEQLVEKLKEYDGTVLMLDEFLEDLEDMVYERDDGALYYDSVLVSWILEDIAAVVEKYLPLMEEEDRKKLEKLLH